MFAICSRIIQTCTNWLHSIKINIFNSAMCKISYLLYDYRCNQINGSFHIYSGQLKNRECFICFEYLKDCQASFRKRITDIHGQTALSNTLVKDHILRLQAHSPGFNHLLSLIKPWCVSVCSSKLMYLHKIKGKQFTWGMSTDNCEGSFGTINGHQPNVNT